VSRKHSYKTYSFDGDAAMTEGDRAGVIAITLAERRARPKEFTDVKPSRKRTFEASSPCGGARSIDEEQGNNISALPTSSSHSRSQRPKIGVTRMTNLMKGNVVQLKSGGPR
jgi:hypothetical protein